MITVATVNSLQEADAVRVRLEASGIAVFLPDEFLCASVVAGAGAFGGVRIQVDEADAARARELLVDLEAPAGAKTFRCPTCGSVDVACQQLSLVSTLLCLLVCLVGGRPSVTCTCRACGHIWKTDR